MFNIKSIAVIALILLLVGITGAVFTFKSAEPEVLEEEIEVSDEEFTHVDIIVDNSEVKVLPTNEQTATVEFLGNQANESKYNLRAKVEGDTLFISMKEKRFKWLNVDFTLPNSSLTVYLPEKLYESVRIETDNGRVQAGELQTKDVNVNSNNGQIELENVNGSTITTKTDNGRIMLEDVEGKLSARTGNGEISLRTDHLDRPIEFETDNGRIEIQTENEPTNAIFEIQVDNGKATIFGNSHWNTGVGNGDNLIKLTTNNGNINVAK
ncbi:DUF4097 family beta strand repeat-containing protein [Virgibacillus ainsalahensis]